MKILLDTNIIIDRESHNTKNLSIGNLYKWIDKMKYEKFIHPDTFNEMMKYHDETLNKSMAIKLSSYESLTINEDYSTDFLKVINKYSLKPNDEIDNSMLYQVFINRVEIFITEDQKIIKKALELGLENRVLTINRFITKMVNENPELIDYKVLPIKKIKLGLLDLSNPFFDSFKESYKEFRNWFNSKSNEFAYACIQNNDILGLLFIKSENETTAYNDISPSFSICKRLKISTFKVEAVGFRLGERCLKIVFDNALKLNVDEIYVTLFDNINTSSLKALLLRWGFCVHGHKISNDGSELVLVKKLKQYNKNLSVKENFPNIEMNVSKYFLPIKPEYHTNLFPDSMLKNEKTDKSLITDLVAHRFALQKVYITQLIPRNVKPGSLVFIYRMGDKEPKRYSSVLTTIAVIDSIKVANSLDELKNECKNRSVFTENELVNFWPNYRTIIKLIDVKPLEKKITLNTLIDMRIFGYNEGPRILDSLTDQTFSDILSASNTKL
ncbi:MAG: hypothetical protein RBQ97_08280 [Acholeplasma sp.]|nr:hypothetical protein [Acholeplasma sp.]